MKKQRFTETQIVSILKQCEGERDTMDLSLEYGISKARNGQNPLIYDGSTSRI